MSNIGVEVGRRDVLRWVGAGVTAIAGPVCIAGATRDDERGNGNESRWCPDGCDDTGSGGETVSIGATEARDTNSDGGDRAVDGDGRTTMRDIDVHVERMDVDGASESSTQFDSDRNGRFDFAEALDLLRRV